jgi:hypothetical protein
MTKPFPTVLNVGRPAGGRRGSTFLLVISILALTVLISATLAYNARLDLLAARNYSDRTGARIAVASGLSAAPPFLMRFTAVTAPTQLWAKRYGSVRADDANFLLSRARNGELTAHGAAPAPPAATLPSTYQDRIVVDLAGRLNINWAGSLASWDAKREGEGSGLGVHELRLEAALAAILEQEKLDAGLAGSIAREILETRLGADRAPGAEGVDDNGNAARTRLENDGLDNDHDGSIDNPEEALLSVERLDRDIRWVADSIRRVDSSDRELPFFALENNGLDDWGLGDARDDEGIDEPAEARGDFRRPAAGDDFILPTTRFLETLPSVTPAIAARLAPYITTFSVSPNVVVVEGAVLPRLNLHTADYDAIVAQLRAVYEARLPDDLLVQYALNVVDRRDPDTTRTEGSTKDGVVLRGFEVVPFITEVYPNARTLSEQGDDGQFIEIHNPWNEPIDLKGWSLKAGGVTAAFEKELPAGGYLVVTDDDQDMNDPEENQDSGARTGSLFGIFGVVESGLNRQIVEVPGLSLGDEFGLAQLIDPNGEVADEFAWKNELLDGTTMSHQRLHPAFALDAIIPATPLAPTQEWERRRDLPAFFTVPERNDALFSSLAELLAVPSGWLDKHGADAAGKLALVDQFPRISGGDRNLDGAITDLFFLGPPASAQADLSGLDPDVARVVLEEAYEQAFRHGLLNINTASRPVLMALPGMDERLADAIVAWRDEVLARVRESEESALPEVPFARPSDLLANDELWDGVSDDARIAQYGKMANLITVSSAAFEVTSFILKRDENDPTLLKRQAVRGIVALDSPRGQVLTFEMVR